MSSLLCYSLYSVYLLLSSLHNTHSIGKNCPHQEYCSQDTILDTSWFDSKLQLHIQHWGLLVCLCNLINFSERTKHKYAIISFEFFYWTCFSKHWYRLWLQNTWNSKESICNKIVNTFKRKLEYVPPSCTKWLYCKICFAAYASYILGQ